jgi:hypothetical protein
MSIDLSKLQWWQYVLAFVLWICLGIILEVIKLVLSTLGNSGSLATEKLKKVSHTGRTEILSLDSFEIEMKFVKSISRVLGSIKCSMLAWSNNFLQQVVKSEDGSSESSVEPTVFPDPLRRSQPEQEEEDGDTYLSTCKNKVVSVFVSQPGNKYAGQQVVGAFVGFLALLLFVYADAAQGAQTFTLLFEDKIPDFLNSIIIPLMTASVGSALILGVLIGDLLGLTHLGLYEKKTPRAFLWITCINLLLSLTLSTVIALARMKLLGTDIAEVQMLVNIAQSVVILPMLITTALLFKAWIGIFVILGMLLSVFAVPFAVFEFIVRILADLLRYGVVGGKFIISRIVWLVLGTFELVFLLLELAIKGSFSVLMYMVIGVFFIPNAIFTGVLMRSNTKGAFDEFLEALLKTKLNVNIVDAETKEITNVQR